MRLLCGPDGVCILMSPNTLQEQPLARVRKLRARCNTMTQLEGLGWSLTGRQLIRNLTMAPVLNRLAIMSAEQSQSCGSFTVGLEP